ncbi:MAG: HEAT repeat domain-containing protein [Planctomycetes bacterium]|nr:HEAT repeat domain-containing protein [Planctomycetota bacterium]
MITALFLSALLFVGDDLAALEKKLRSSDDRERSAAVQELAKLGTKDAWSRVIDALKDPSSMVGDEAEMQLSKLNDPDLVEDLCGKRGLASSDEKVQLRAAGALGALETGTLPGVKLAPGLTTKSVVVRRTLRASVERLAGMGRITAPDRVVGGLETWMKSSEDPEVRAAGLSALVRIPDHIPPSPVELARDSDPAPLTCAILRLLSGATDQKSRAYIAACAVSNERSVRSQVVETIAARPDADGLKLLVTMFEKEQNRRVAWAIDGTLEKLSGLSGGGKAEFWRRWVDNLGAEWKPATGGKPSSERAGETTAPKLAGFPIIAGGIAILVDLSGSTWEKRSDGQTRKDRLDEELRKALESLPPDTLFNLIPYTAEPIPFEKSLILATPSNVQRALKFFTSNKSSGKGNVWSAIDLALEDERVDTILVLTDGAPTGGLHWNIDLMNERYNDRNRFRHVVLDAILVDASKRLQEKWKLWCEATGGRMMSISMK